MDHCWSYRCWNGWGVCPDAITPAPAFRGSFWGVVGKHLTRLGEYVKSEDELQPPVEPYYPYPHRKPHPTLSRELPNLSRGGTEYYCFGAACTMIADTAVHNTTGERPQYVWAWLHYVPVGESDLTNAIAGFARAKCGSYVEGRLTAMLDEPDVWLVDKVGGGAEKWDAYEKLDIYEDHVKAFVGSSNVGWFEKRISGGTQNRITFYTLNSATPTVQTWDNSAYLMDENAYCLVADVSRNGFPRSIGCRVELDHFGDSTPSVLRRYWLMGDLNTSNGRIERPPTVDEDIWDIYATFGTSNSCLGAYSGDLVTRFSEDSPAITSFNSQTIIRSWEASSCNFLLGDDEEAVWYKNLTDAAVFHGPSYEGETTLYGPEDVAEGEPIPVFQWDYRNSTHSPFWTYSGSAIFIPVGQATHPMHDAPDDDVERSAIFRFLPGHGCPNQTEYSVAAFLGLRNGDFEQDAAVIFFASSEQTEVPATPSTDPPSYYPAEQTIFEGGNDLIAGLQASGGSGSNVRSGSIAMDNPLLQASMVRVAIDYRSGANPTPYYRLVVTGAAMTRDADTWAIYDPDGVATEQPLPDGWTWSVVKLDGNINAFSDWSFMMGAPKPDTEPDPETPWRAVAAFYDASTPGVLESIPAPTGFWQPPPIDPEDPEEEPVILKARFAIQQAYDTAHPEDEQVWEPALGWDE